MEHEYSQPPTRILVGSLRRQMTVSGVLRHFPELKGLTEALHPV
jgi:hypothetical protein